MIKKKAYARLSKSEIFHLAIAVLNDSKLPILKYRLGILYFSNLKNLCVFTGTSRTVYSKFKISRISIQKKLIKADILAVSRSTW